MARPLRLSFENAVYHIVCRGNRREPIFTGDRDKRTFIGKMDEAFAKYSFFCYAFCLMDNHYHLMVQTPLANISEGLHSLNSSYSNWFRSKHDLEGPLFQGRYKSLVIDTDTYALQLSAYIHLNPCRAGMVKQPEDYQWSSYRDYIGARKSIANCLDITFILNQISLAPVNAQAKYHQFVAENIGMANPCDDVFKGIALGDARFLDKINAMIETGGYHREIPATRNISSLSPDDVLEAVSTLTGKSIEEILARKRGNILRQLSIFLVKKITPLSLQDVGAFFGMDYAAVSQAASRFARRADENVQLSAMLNEIENHLKAKS